jgi:cell wall-associated NlpC family hydrolase
VTATQGLGLLGTTDIILAGATIRADVSEAISDVTLHRTIDGASTIVLAVQDSSRVLLRSKILASRTTCTLDGLHFELVKIAKSGDLLTLTFEAASVAALRRAKGQYAVAAGTMSRTTFARRIVNQTHGIGFVGYPEPGATKVPLTRGSADTPQEDSWTALTRLASEVNWRCFESAGTIYFGPDSWLISRPSAGTIRENTGAIDTIDFDFDTGKPLTNLTVTCIAAAWAYPPGSAVTLAGMGVGDGPKLVTSTARSLFFTTATINLTAPQKALPEPAANATGTTATAGGAATGTAPTSAAGVAVATAQAQIGVPYVWGGESPSGFDCSGLMQFAYARAGITIPRTAQAQHDATKSVSTSALLPGDLVFFGTSAGSITHCGMYIGGGLMVDAPHRGANVRTDSINGFSPALVGASRPT